MFVSLNPCSSTKPRFSPTFKKLIPLPYSSPLHPAKPQPRLIPISHPIPEYSHNQHRGDAATNFLSFQKLYDCSPFPCAAVWARSLARGGGESISKQGAQSQGTSELPQPLEELLNILNISRSEIETRHPRSSQDFNFL